MNLISGFKMHLLLTALLLRFLLARVAGENQLYTCTNLTDVIPAGCVEVSGTSTTAPALIAEDVGVKVYVWVMVPFENSYMFSKDHIQGAIYKGLNDSGAVECQNQTAYKDKICFEIYFDDTKCDADYVMNEVVDIQDKYILGSEQCTGEGTGDQSRSLQIFLGMTCDYAAGRVAALSSHWSWTDIFPGTRAISFDNKSPSSAASAMVRPGHTASDVGRFTAELFLRYNWTKSAVVYTSETNHGAHVWMGVASDCPTLMGGVTSQFRNKLGWKKNQQYDIIDYPTDSLVADDVKELLGRIKHFARVSTWCVGRKVMRHVMDVAEEMGMTNGDYSFLYLDIYNTNSSYTWSDVDDQSYYPEPNITVANNPASLRALQVISLYQSSSQKYQNFSEYMKNEMAAQNVTEYGEFVNPFVPQYYNSIRLLVNTVETAVEKNATNLANGREFAMAMWNTSFDSVDGIVTISEQGDRLMDYVLMDMDPKTQKFEMALIYFGRNQSIENVTAVDWPGSTVPHITNVIEIKDGQIVTRILISVLVILFVTAFLAIIFIQRRLNRERKLRMMPWKIEKTELKQPGRPRAGSVSKESTITSPSMRSETVRQRFTATRVWKGNEVAYKELDPVMRVNVDRKVMVELQQMLSVENQHICKFLGAGVDPPLFFVHEYCSRGSLQDILEGSIDWDMDDVFRNSLISDVAHGMHYLHRSPIHSHGRLKSSNCLVDSRFVVKIADFGLPSFRQKKRKESDNEYSVYKNMLWTAPELLRSPNPPILGTQKGDVYSFAIICQEILYTKGVFYLGESAEALQPKDIYSFVVTPVRRGQFFRPFIEDDDDVIVGGIRRSLVQRCWSETPELRPNFSDILHVTRRFHKEKNLVDSLLKRLEQHAYYLEDKVEERTAQYKSEKERADTLLYQMLPKSVADRLKRGESACPESFDSVTIYFSDIVGFTAISHDSTPIEVVGMLNDLYTKFDNIIDSFDVYKVETIGDAYMVVSGLPERNDDRHASQIAKMALKLLEAVKSFTISHMPDTKMKLRIGIHTGPVVAGVVGRKMPRYCLFGDTVNTAARMEQNGQELKIHVSPATKEVLNQHGAFHFQQREDKVFLKGIGYWTTWWLEGVDDSLDGTNPQDVSPKISGSSGYSTTSSGTQFDHNDNGLSLLDARKSVTGAYGGEFNTSYKMEPDVSRTSRNHKRRRRLPQSVTSDICITGVHSSEDDTSRSETSIGVQSTNSEDRIMQMRKTKRDRRRRTGSIDGLPVELQVILPELRLQQQKRMSSGLTPPPQRKEMEKLVKSRKQKSVAKKATKVKFALDMETGKTSGKRKKSPAQVVSANDEHRDSGVGITYENHVFENLNGDDENTIF